MLCRGPLTRGEGRDLSLFSELGQSVTQTPPLPITGGRRERKKGHGLLHRWALRLSDKKARSCRKFHKEISMEHCSNYCFYNTLI